MNEITITGVIIRERVLGWFLQDNKDKYKNTKQKF